LRLAVSCLNDAAFSVFGADEDRHCGGVLIKRARSQGQNAKLAFTARQWVNASHEVEKIRTRPDSTP
jgi:hypothetical protein